MMSQIRPALSMLLIFTLILGVMYPLAITAIAYSFFPKQAAGSLIIVNGSIAGSELIGQNFNSPRYFHGRPSISGYDALRSGGSNYAQSNMEFIRVVGEKVKFLNAKSVPADMVLASASGLDPHISVESALMQVPRIAKERNLPESRLNDLISRSADKSIFREPIVNVLNLNIALDNGN